MIQYRICVNTTIHLPYTYNTIEKNEEAHVTKRLRSVGKTPLNACNPTWEDFDEAELCAIPVSKRAE